MSNSEKKYGLKDDDFWRDQYKNVHGEWPTGLELSRFLKAKGVKYGDYYKGEQGFSGGKKHSKSKSKKTKTKTKSTSKKTKSKTKSTSKKTKSKKSNGMNLWWF